MKKKFAILILTAMVFLLLAGNEMTVFSGNKIYIYFTQSGRDWEIMGNIQILQDGKEVTNQLAGIRTHEGSSRWGNFKRMSYFSRNIYSGNEYFDGFLINGKKIHSMRTDTNFTSILFQNLLQNHETGIQDYESAAVFLNGEFWTQGCILGRYDRYYFEQHYGVSPENVIFIRDGEVSVGEESDRLIMKF